MAVPERINLYRAQASRAVGGNGRRTSHNPPAPEMLDIYDRVGMVVMDENRLFANTTPFVLNVGAMVKRDRNHPSVTIWSFCNEAGCEGDQEEGGPRFQEIAYRYDGSRPTLANMFTFNDLLSKTVDVQGFSHQDRKQLDDCHSKMPDKPIFMSECCSCNTMRDEDVGCESSNGQDMCIQKSFNADCVADQTNASNGADYAIGTMVWTLFDYYGEPSGHWPHTTSTYGQYDLSGFAKAAAHWYRAFWLHAIPDTNADKAVLTGNRHVVHIVESWESPDSFPLTKGNKSREIHVYSDTPQVELFVNGKSMGRKRIANPSASSDNSWAFYSAVPFIPGNLTAVALDTNGQIVAQHSRFTSGEAVALKLSIDSPSPTTGTGSALLLDGQDAALIRATIVDAKGQVAHFANHNVSFTIKSGPGRIVGTNNGDTSNHEPNHAPWHSAYHGLVRAVIKVTQDRATPAWQRLRMLEIDGQHNSVVVNPNEAQELDSLTGSAIVLEASAPGLAPVQIAIPVSDDAKTHSVMSVASQSIGQQLTGFFEQEATEQLESVIAFI